MYHLPASDSQPSEGRLLALLAACCYILFTLVPDSHSLMVKWPWVAIWQIGLLCPVFWLLWRFWQQRSLLFLGSGLDWCVGLIVIGLFISSVFAEFPNQARWYAWAAFCLLAALYALNDWLDSSERRYGLLIAQGYLGLAFILVSLSLWTT
ncbi:MAG: O-antigen ligase family protein, partial [Microcystaceae cyanobacterium]